MDVFFSHGKCVERISFYGDMWNLFNLQSTTCGTNFVYGEHVEDIQSLGHSEGIYSLEELYKASCYRKA